MSCFFVAMQLVGSLQSSGVKSSKIYVLFTSNFLKLFLKLTVTFHATDFNPLYITVLKISSLTHDDRKKLTNGANMHVD